MLQCGRRDFYEAQKTRATDLSAAQWLLATIPFILPFLFRFTTFPVLALSQSRLLFMYLAAKMCEEYSSASERETGSPCDFQRRFPRVKAEDCRGVDTLESGLRATTGNVTNTS